MTDGASSSRGELRFAYVRRIAVEGALVLLGSTVFVCLLFWPVTTTLDSTVIGRISEGSDAPSTVWWFWKLVHESGYHIFGSTHHTLTGAIRLGRATGSTSSGSRFSVSRRS